MPSLETLLVFTVAALVLNLSPGPSNFYILSRSVAQGTRAGLVATAGLAAGSLVHVAAAALGLSALFLYSPLAYQLLKLAGAGYLVYLGLRTLLSRPSAVGADGASCGAAAGPAMPELKIFRQSILVEVLNPKTALFFLAFLPQFADAAAGPLAPQILVLGLIVTASALPCDAAVAALSARAARLLAGSGTARAVRRWLPGSVLVGLGLFLALDRRSVE